MKEFLHQMQLINQRIIIDFLRSTTAYYHVKFVGY